MDDKDTEQKPDIQILTPTQADSEDYYTAYANGAQIVHTFFDFQLHFSEVKVRDPKNVVAEGFATILMSPQHAKMFLKHLNQNLELYEAKFGEIKVPEKLLEFQTIDFSLDDKDRKS